MEISINIAFQKSLYASEPRSDKKDSVERWKNINSIFASYEIVHHVLGEMWK